MTDWWILLFIPPIVFAIWRVSREKRDETEDEVQARVW